MTRGVLYIVWPGEERMEAMLNRSIASLAAAHPELPYHVERLDDGSSLLDKSRMAEMTPFDETLFLDADTVVMGRLDYGFEKAAQYGLACCICECPWARRFSGLADQGDIVEYNTGVLFFTRTSRPLFDAWARLRDIGSSLLFRAHDGVRTMPFNDQAGFAAAIEETGFNPFVLPMNWNFRRQWQETVFGPVKIWHGYNDPPPQLKKWNESQSMPGAIFHCGRLH